MDTKYSEPAFPIEDKSLSPSPGLSKREWFAGQALAGAMSTIHDIPPGQLRFDWMARDCVIAADALIGALRE
jgi:hypothetical protein